MNRVKNWIWKKLEWLEKKQKWFWAIFFVVMAVWTAFDIGGLVTKNEIQNLNVKPTGTWSTHKFSQYIQTNKGGSLVLLTKGRARFYDGKGQIWLLPDFKDNATDSLLKSMKKQNVKLKGDFSIQQTPSIESTQGLMFIVFLDILRRFLGFLVPFLFIGMIIYFYRHTKASANKFNRIEPGGPSAVRFSDIAGQVAAKQEVLEIVDYLKDPSRFERVGAKPIEGILLHGPPGTGKTMLAKALAGEANASFIEQNASSFVEIYAGQGARSVRSLFEAARQSAPSVVFIDELDAVGGMRGRANSHSEDRQTINALLTEMGGFKSNTGVVVIAATNRIEDLDPALIRAGRFSRRVLLSLPAQADRLAILNQYVKKLPSYTVNVEKWATQTPGFSGADLSNLVNEAAYEAARKNKSVVDDEDFSLARDKVLMGVRDLARQPTITEIKTVAFHELGHALVRICQGGKIDKISIQPRGQALGATIVHFDESNRDQALKTPSFVKKELLVLMGGRAAEEIFMGEVSGGAVDDLQKASALAREAVHLFGFQLEGSHQNYIPEHSDLLLQVEEGARKWIEESYQEAKQLIRQHQSSFKKAAEKLIEKEVLSGEELVSFFESSSL